MLIKFIRLWKNSIEYIKTMNKVCINIGCGHDIRHGWINCDLIPIDETVIKLDITSKNDLLRLSKYKSDLIVCNHVIGYLNYIQVLNFVNACYEGLNENGKLIFEFPDIIKISNAIINYDYNNLSLKDYVEIVRGIHAYDFNDIFDEKFDKQTYIFGWSSIFLVKMLESKFKNIEVKNPLYHNERKWRDVRVEAIKKIDI
jgi:predicted SAM-dependent methyltransferase